ncbi:MAG: ribosome maturation factor RimM [Hyphomicrobium sp.]
MDQNQSAKSTDSLVLLGQIGAAHGIRGDVLIRTFTAEPASIAAYGPLTDKVGQRLFKVNIVRVTEKGVVARIAGVTDRNGAEALRGIELYVARSRLPKPADAEYYHADLIGLDAVLADGTPFGRVVAVQNFGAGDLLEIQRANADTEFIPFTNANAPDVDLERHRVTVIPPTMVGESESANPDDQS